MLKLPNLKSSQRVKADEERVDFYEHITVHCGLDSISQHDEGAIEQQLEPLSSIPSLYASNFECNAVTE